MFQNSPWAQAENVGTLLDKSSISSLQCIALQQCHLFYILHTMVSLITHICPPLFYMSPPPRCWGLNSTSLWTRKAVEVHRDEEEEMQKEKRNKRTANEIGIRLLVRYCELFYLLLIWRFRRMPTIWLSENTKQNATEILKTDARKINFNTWPQNNQKCKRRIVFAVITCNNIFYKIS